MASGLLALLDDVAGIAKVAAASVDDVMGQAAKAGSKAAGVVIDDAAVTPRYAVGFAADRELPIVWRIALGSLRNKLLFLLPGALVLALVAPWVITPLLMAGGVYLCFEGAEKLVDAVMPHHEPSGASGAAALDADALENQKVASAIKTDFILSAEIMAITLSTVSEASFWTQAIVLAVVGIGITVAVYGAVALIVKADDAGVVLARQGSAILRWFGRGLVQGMPHFLAALAAVGTAAMLWVGGGIIIHGLEVFGLGGIAHAVHDVSAGAALSLPAFAGVVEWLVGAVLAAVFGLVVGGAAIVVMHYAVEPALRLARSG